MIALPERIRWLSQSVSFGLLGKGIGFVVPIVIAATYGVTRGTDSFFLAFSIAALLVAVWGQSLEQFAVPLFASEGTREGIEVRKRWLEKRASLSAVMTFILGGAGLGSYLVLTGDADFRNQTLTLYLLLGPQVIASGFGAIYSAYLISRREYRWPAGTIGLRGAGVLVAVAVSSGKLGLASVSIGYSAGELARVIVLRALYESKRAPESDFLVESVAEADRSIMVRGGYQLGSMALAGVGPVVERSFAATLGAGAITRLDYAAKLFYMPAIIFDTNFVAVFLSDWSRLVALKDWAGLVRDIRKSLVYVALISAAVTVVTILFRAPIVSLVLQRGSFPATEVGVVADLLGILMLALPFAAAGMLGSAACVALGANRLIFRLGVLKMIVRSGGAVALGSAYGLEGVAIAFVLMHVIELAILASAIGPSVKACAAGRVPLWPGGNSLR